MRKCKERSMVKMQNPKQLDAMIKNALQEKAEEIQVNQDNFRNIVTEINLYRSGDKMLNKNNKLMHISLKKSIAIAACFALVIGGSVIAVGAGLNKGYLTEKDYQHLQSSAQISKDAGFTVKVPSSLPGDFKLTREGMGKYVDGTRPDAKDNKKDVGGIYTNSTDKNKFVALDIVNDDYAAPIFTNGKTVNIGKVTAAWAEYNTHIVSPDYMRTKQDKEDEKAGKEVFIMTASKVKDNKESINRLVSTHALRWVDNNIAYTLTDNGNGLTQEEMIKMADSIINSK